MSVKQRPGLNYPKPVNNIHIDETNRAPARLFRGTVPGPLQNLLRKSKDLHNANAECEECL